MGRSKNPRKNFTGDEAITRIPPNVPVSRPIGDIGVGGGPGIPPKFPRGGRRDRRSSYPAPRADGRGFRQPPPGYKYDEIDRLVPIDTPPLVPPKEPLKRDIIYRDGEGPLRPAPRRRDIIFRDGEGPLRPAPRRRKRRGGRRIAGRRMPPSTSPVIPKDILGEPPEREVPLPPEYRERITRESDPRGPAPFMPRDERRRDRFFEERSDRRAERRSDRKDRREEFMNEINVGREQRAMQREEKRDIARSRREERRMRQDENRGRRRNFRRRRSRMERRRSRRERAAFRDRFVSTLRR